MRRILERGHRWEPIVLEMLVDELTDRGHEVEVIATGQRYLDPDLSFLAAEIDDELIVDGEPVNGEIKTAGYFASCAWGEYDSIEVPIYYLAQVMHGLMIQQGPGPRDVRLLFTRAEEVGFVGAIGACRPEPAQRLMPMNSRVIALETSRSFAESPIGGVPIVQVDKTRPLPEHPLPGYPASKAAAERLVRAASDLHTVVVRPRLVWGVGDTSVLPQMVGAVRAGRFRWISGGRYLTSTCHVDNVVEGTLLAAERGRKGEVYFLTDGAPVELRGFVRELLATQGIDAGEGSVPRAVAKSPSSGSKQQTA